MNHQHVFQTYTLGSLMFLLGSFRINGTSNPDNKRDGRSGAIASVTRVSAGKFTITFDDGFLLPEKLIVDPLCKLHQSATPTYFMDVKYIKDTYSYVTRSFQVQCFKVNADGADGGSEPDATAADPDDNDVISFFGCGSISSAGTDTTT